MLQIRKKPKENPSVSGDGHCQSAVPFEPSFPGFTSHAGLNFGDWFVLMVQVEAIYLDTVGTNVGWYGGFKLGSYPGLIGGVASFILVIIAYSTVTVTN